MVHAEATAKIQGIVVNADSMFRDTDNETMDLEGHVQVISQTQHISADKAHVDLRARHADLSGHVEITTTKTTAGGSSASLDYENSTGVIYDGFVKSGPVVFTGSVLQRLSEDEYYVSDADYTTCTNCPPTWSFSGTRIRAQLGGYAYIKNSFLKVYSVPVIWLPYLIVPLKSDRQTGLLTPQIETSSQGGLAFAESFFWAISRDTDATFTFKSYEKRGAKAMGEYRYVLDENSGGNLNFAFLNDRVFKQDPRVTYFESPQTAGSDINRWFIKYNHYMDLPNGYVERAQINAASDLQYSKDFPDETQNLGDAAMENRFSLTKNTEDLHVSVDSSIYTDMLQANPLAGNTNSVQRLPEIRVSQVEKKLGDSGFLYSYNLDYTNFARASSSFDSLQYFTPQAQGTIYRGPADTTPGGVCNPNNMPQQGASLIPGQFPYCQPAIGSNYTPATQAPQAGNRGDLIRTGQRTMGRADLYRPFTVSDYIDVLPSASYEEDHYNFDVGGEPDNIRRYMRTTVSAKTTLSQVYGSDDADATHSDKYLHEIQPEIAATTVPWLDHPSNPFFGLDKEVDGSFYSNDFISNSDTGLPSGLQFDYNDRLLDRSLVTLALNNKLVQKTWVGDKPQYQQIASLKIYQSYDAYQASLSNRTRPLWTDLGALLNVHLKHFSTYVFTDYYPNYNLTNVASWARVNDDWGHFIQLGWTRNYNIVPGEGSTTPNAALRTEEYALSGGFVSKYINLMGKFVYDGNWQNDAPTSTSGILGLQHIKSWAYIAQIKPAGDCWMINLTQDKIIGGDQIFRVEFAFNFDGIPKPPIPPEALDAL